MYRQPYTKTTSAAAAQWAGTYRTAFGRVAEHHLLKAPYLDRSGGVQTHAQG